MKLEKIIFQVNRFALPTVTVLFLTILTFNQFPKTSAAKWLVVVGIKASDLKWLLVLTLTVGCIDLLIGGLPENRLGPVQSLPRIVMVSIVFIAGITIATLSLGVYSDVPIGLAAIMMFLSTTLILLLMWLFDSSTPNNDI